MRKFIISILALGLSFSMLGFTDVQAEEHIVENDYTYEMALNSVIKQLEEQNAMGLLPVYLEILKEDFGPENRGLSTYSSRVYLPRGGHIYYANYLGGGAKVSEIYYTKAETTKHLNGSMGGDWIAFLINLPFKYKGADMVSVVTGLLGLYSTWFRRTVDNGSGQIRIVASEDKYDSAVVTIHWASAPYAQTSSGARVTYP